MQLGIPELLLILLIALFLFGSRRLPEMARSVGTAIRSFRKEAGEDPPTCSPSIDPLMPATLNRVDEAGLARQLEEARTLIRVMQLLKNRISVFVCSTMGDLQGERRGVASTIESLLATRPWLFEDHGGPQHEYVEQVCLDAVRKCDILLVLVGTGVSRIVLKEYAVALETGKPVLAYVKECARTDEAERFLAKMNRDGVTWAGFDSIEELQIKVRSGVLNHIIERYLDYGLSKREVAVLLPLAKELERMLQLHKKLEEYDERLTVEPEAVELLEAREITKRRLQAGEATFSRAASSTEGELALHHQVQGDVHFHRREYRQAFAEYTRCIGLNPGNAYVHGQRSGVCVRLGDYRRAIDDASRAIELDPRYAWAYALRAQAYNGLRDYGRVIDDASRAIELDPRYAWAYARRADAYNGLRDYRRAAADLRKARKLG